MVDKHGWRRVTTTIPNGIYGEAKKRHILVSSLIISGWNAQSRMAALLGRVRFLEAEVNRLQGQLNTLGRQFWATSGPGNGLDRSRR